MVLSDLFHFSSVSLLHLLYLVTLKFDVVFEGAFWVSRSDFGSNDLSTEELGGISDTLGALASSTPSQPRIVVASGRTTSASDGLGLAYGSPEVHVSDSTTFILHR